MPHSTAEWIAWLAGSLIVLLLLLGLFWLWWRGRQARQALERLQGVHHEVEQALIHSKMTLQATGFEKQQAQEELSRSTQEVNQIREQLTYVEQDLSRSQEQRHSLELELTQLTSQLESARQNLSTWKEGLEGQWQQLFESLSQRTLTQVSDRLEEQQKKEAHGQQERLQESIRQLLDPLQKLVTENDQKVQQLGEQTLRETSSLKAHLEQMMLTARYLNETKNRLVSVLDDNKQRGNWGEFQLQRLLDLSGLIRDRHYKLQPTLEGGEARPDVCIYLPNDRVIFIDVKTLTGPLTHDMGQGQTQSVSRSLLPASQAGGGENNREFTPTSALMETTDDTEHATTVKVEHPTTEAFSREAEDVPESSSVDVLSVEQRKQMTQALRTEIQKLHKRQYQSKYQGKGEAGQSVEFVILYVPRESLLRIPLEEDPTLLDDAFRQGIVLSSPLILMGTLKIVAQCWSQFSVQQNAQDIQALAKELHKRAALFLERFEDIETALKGVDNKVELARKSLTGQKGMLPQLRKLEDFGAKSDRSVPESFLLEEVTTSP